MTDQTMGSVLETVAKHSSLMGWSVIVLSLLLFVGGVAMFIVVPGRRPVLWFLVLSLLPFVLGLCGTVIGFRSAFKAVEAVGGNASPEDLACARTVAMGMSHMGLICSALLWVVGLVALALKRPAPRLGRSGQGLC